jgi:hypothetical protein
MKLTAPKDFFSIPGEFTTDSISLFLITFYAGSAVTVKQIFSPGREAMIQSLCAVQDSIQRPSEL